MRGYYVTRKRAGHLAATILESAEISEVYLFGSLARLNRRHPRDIDLLIFDHGEFSALGVHYGSTDPVILAEYFDKLFSPSAIVFESAPPVCRQQSRRTNSPNKKY
jgi:hypothetical protein